MLFQSVPTHPQPFSYWCLSWALLDPPHWFYPILSSLAFLLAGWWKPFSQMYISYLRSYMSSIYVISRWTYLLLLLMVVVSHDSFITNDREDSCDHSKMAFLHTSSPVSNDIYPMLALSCLLISPKGESNNGLCRISTFYGWSNLSIKLVAWKDVNKTSKHMWTNSTGKRRCLSSLFAEVREVR